MAKTVKDPKNYPVLRNLQYSPLKQGEEQYIVLWDPTGLSTEKLVIPLNLFYLFQFFDGEHSLDQVGVEYLKKYGEFMLPDRLTRLVSDLEDKLFLEGERYETAKAAAVEAYRNAATRPAVFAGKSYEANKEDLEKQLAGFFASKEGPEKTPSEHHGQRIKAIVAPNYELKGAGPLYAWAYKELNEADTPDVFVILGTAHAALDGAIALTDKDFETPLGVVRTNREIVAHIRANGGAGLFDEEIRHQHDPSIEFQLPFLQYTVGKKKPFSIVPVLCSFPPACLADVAFKDQFEQLGTFLQAFRSAVTATKANVCFVASANLAHIGLRYGDNKPPTDFSFHRCMQTDLEMLKHVENIEPEAFAQFILKEGDKRHILGFPAIFTMLKLVEAEKGQVLRYDRGITDQFNSTITYASMAFY